LTVSPISGKILSDNTKWVAGLLSLPRRARVCPMVVFAEVEM